MSEEITLYKFKKRLNSTKQASNGIPKYGDFKGPVDIMTPTIDLEMPGNSFDYNYLTWNDSANNLMRYYWIRHKVYYPDNIVRLTLEEDVLPTFKDEIEACEFLIERSTTISSPMATDTAPLSENGVSIEYTSADEFEHYKNGWYVVGIAGGDTSPLSPAFAEAGGVYYYFCDYSTVNTLLRWLNGNGASGEWADYNPLSRVISIRYFPVAPPSSFITENTATLFSHSYDSGEETVHVHYDWNGHFVNTTSLSEVTHDVVYTKSFTMAFSNHSQYSGSLKFLNFAPYRELILFAGGFGKIDIPLDLLPQNDTDNVLTVSVSFDLITGLSRLELYFDDDRTNLIYSTEDYSMTVNCSITSESYNKYSDILARDLRKTQYNTEFISKAGAGAAAMIAGAAMQNPMVFGSGVALIGSAASTQITGLKQYALDSYNLSVPDFHTKASNGSFSIIEKPWRLYTISHRILSFPYDLCGYLCNLKRPISSSLLYTKCLGASFQSEKATLEEIVAINEFLNGGFYNE